MNAEKRTSVHDVSEDPTDSAAADPGRMNTLNEIRDEAVHSSQAPIKIVVD